MNMNPMILACILVVVALAGTGTIVMRNRRARNRGNK
jgi:hypothetical protein